MDFVNQPPAYVLIREVDNGFILTWLENLSNSTRPREVYCPDLDSAISMARARFMDT